MKATIARLTAPRSLEWVEEEIGDEPAPTEVIAETLTSAVSVGTEIAAYDGLPPLRPGPIYPRVVGYCNVARVVRVGDQVSGVAKGDRIVTTQSHRSAFRCDQSQILGVLDADADAGRASTTYLFHLGYSTLLNAEASMGDDVAVVGLGVLGMGAVACAAFAGARATGFSDQPIDPAVADAFGADRIFPKSGDDVVEAYRQHLGRPGADVVVLTSDRWEDYLLSMQLLRPRGTMAILGFPGRGREPASFNPLDSQYFYDKQLRIQSSNWSPERLVRPERGGDIRSRNCDVIIRAIGDGRLPAEHMLSGESEWDQLGAVYDRLSDRRSGELSHLLRWAT